MGKISVNRVTNANVYIDGDSFLGKVEEITLPDLKPMMSEHKALGLVGKFELPSGFEKMEGKIKFNSLYPAVSTKFANVFGFMQLQVRANIETISSSGRSEAPWVCLLTIQSKKYQVGGFKQHDNVERESDFNVLYIKEIIDGEVKLEVDVLSNIYKVDGVDLLAKYNKNLGV
jgi:uncharacterized protein